MVLCSGHPIPQSITPPPIGPWNKLTEGDHRLHPTVQNVTLVSRSEVTPWRNGFNCSHQLLGRKAVVVVTMGGGGGIEWGEVPSKSARENFSLIQLLSLSMQFFDRHTISTSDIITRSQSIILDNL